MLLINSQVLIQFSADSVSIEPLNSGEISYPYFQEVVWKEGWKFSERLSTKFTGARLYCCKCWSVCFSPCANFSFTILFPPYHRAFPRALNGMRCTAPGAFLMPTSHTSPSTYDIHLWSSLSLFMPGCGITPHPASCHKMKSVKSASYFSPMPLPSKSWMLLWHYSFFLSTLHHLHTKHSTWVHSWMWIKWMQERLAEEY